MAGFFWTGFPLNDFFCQVFPFHGVSNYFLPGLPLFFHARVYLTCSGKGFSHMFFAFLKQGNSLSKRLFLAKFFLYFFGQVLPYHNILAFPFVRFYINVLRLDFFLQNFSLPGFLGLSKPGF